MKLPYCTTVYCIEDEVTVLYSRQSSQEVPGLEQSHSIHVTITVQLSRGAVGYSIAQYCTERGKAQLQAQMELEVKLKADEEARHKIEEQRERRAEKTKKRGKYGAAGDAEQHHNRRACERERHAEKEMEKTNKKKQHDSACDIQRHVAVS